MQLQPRCSPDVLEATFGFGTHSWACLRSPHIETAVSPFIYFAQDQADEALLFLPMACNTMERGDFCTSPFPELPAASTPLPILLRLRFAAERRGKPRRNGVGDSDDIFPFQSQARQMKNLDAMPFQKWTSSPCVGPRREDAAGFFSAVVRTGSGVEWSWRGVDGAEWAEEIKIAEHRQRLAWWQPHRRLYRSMMPCQHQAIMQISGIRH